MTLRELSQLRYLNQEIEMDKCRLRELQAKALPGSQQFTWMPHSSEMADKVAQYACEMADLRQIIEEKRLRCLRERKRLEAYIAAIDDSLLRQIFTYRFVRGFPWSKVAAFVGGRNTAETVRQAAWRYIKNSET